MLTARVILTRGTPVFLLLLVAIFLVSCANKQRDAQLDGQAIALPATPTTVTADHSPPARTPVN